MNPYIRKTIVCTGWLALLLPLCSFIAYLLISLYVGSMDLKNVGGSDPGEIKDQLLEYWMSPILVSTFFIVVGSAYSGLLLGARDKQAFVAFNDLPADMRSDFQYAIGVATLSAVLTLGMGLFFVFGNPGSAAPIHPADMLGAAVMTPVLIFMFYRTKRLAPIALLMCLWISGQLTIYINGRSPSAVVLGMAIFFMTGYVKGIRAAWRYRNGR